MALALFGRSYVGDMTRPGWRGSLPFYVFRCPKHGLVMNYEQGYERRLDCPLCQLASLQGQIDEGEASDDNTYKPLYVAGDYASQLFTTIN